MKTRLFSLLSLSLLMLVMFMSLASAVTSTVFTITDVNAPTSVAEDVGSFTFTFNLTYTGTSEDMDISFDDSTTSIGDISIPTATGMNGSIDESRIITGTISNFLNQGGNTMDIRINATTTGTRDDETTFSVSITNVEEFIFCEYDEGVSENPGELKVTIKDITVTQGFGDDEEWFLFDEVEVEVEVENKGDDDVDDISLEWGLYNEDSDEWAIEMDEEDEFNVKDGDEKKLIITFRVDDDDFDLNLDEFDDDYTLFVRATGEVDDDELNPETCKSDSEPIQIITGDDFIILNDIDFPELVSCGTDVEITADIWNIGDGDQEDVFIMINNKELGIKEQIEIGDVDKFEDEKLVFNFQVPKGAEEKWYTLEFTIYDEDNDVFENSNDDLAEFTASFKVEGSCVVEPQVMVTASLESGGRAGEELIIKATITNTGSKLATYELNAVEYADWATLISVDPNTILVAAGESQDVLITFNANADVSGDKLFNIEVLSGDEVVAEQPVSVTIEKSGASFITGGIISGDNWYLWGIGALNIILVIVIILVAVKVAKK